MRAIRAIRVTRSVRGERHVSAGYGHVCIYIYCIYVFCAYVLKVRERRYDVTTADLYHLTMR